MGFKSWKFHEIENFYDQARVNGLDAQAPNGESMKIFFKKFSTTQTLVLKIENRKKGHDESVLKLYLKF